MILPSSLYGFSRRGFLGSALALGACQPAAQSQTPPVANLPPLKSVAPFPVGTAVQAGHLTDPALARLIAAQASQLTPEWEMQMRSEEHTSELQSRRNLVCRLLLEKKYLVFLSYPFQFMFQSLRP